jgi:hypothetical protein
VDATAIFGGVGVFILGVLLGALLARRGRANVFDWRVHISAREGNPPDEDEPDPPGPPVVKP